MTKSCGHRRIISIHSLRVEGDIKEHFHSFPISISIHSLRVEGDLLYSLLYRSKHLISIHSLRVEGDRNRGCTRLRCLSFQSTPSVWRETAGRARRRAGESHFNPLPPCGGRQDKWARGALLNNFNPLPPCGGRHDQSAGANRHRHFNPLPPCGGRHGRQSRTYNHPISIHSLRVEGDQILFKRQFNSFYFNPLPPCGGRQYTASLMHTGKDFNPLPPCGGRRLRCSLHFSEPDFNPLPPCGGRQFRRKIDCSHGRYFNPLPPCGGRRLRSNSISRYCEFQSTPSVWRETYSIISVYLC